MLSKDPGCVALPELLATQPLQRDSTEVDCLHSMILLYLMGRHFRQTNFCSKVQPNLQLDWANLLDSLALMYEATLLLLLGSCLESLPRQLTLAEVDQDIS